MKSVGIKSRWALMALWLLQRPAVSGTARMGHGTFPLSSPGWSRLCAAPGSLPAPFFCPELLPWGRFASARCSQGNRSGRQPALPRQRRALGRALPPDRFLNPPRCPQGWRRCVTSPKYPTCVLSRNWYGRGAASCAFAVNFVRFSLRVLGSLLPLPRQAGGGRLRDDLEAALGSFATMG